MKADDNQITLKNQGADAARGSGAGGQYIWPEASQLIGDSTNNVLPVFRGALAKAKGVFGVISGLHDAGVGLIEELLQLNRELAFRLVLKVWPACPTTGSNLKRLLELRERFPERLAVRLKASHGILDHGLTILCASGPHPKDSCLILGKMTDLGTISSDIGEGGVLRADAATIEAFRRRFLWQWAHSTELSTPGAADIPALALPEGSREAAARWEDYQDRLNGVTRSAPELTVEVDPETGEVTLVDGNGDPVADPIAEIGFEKMDPLAMWVAELYSAGQIVSIDKTSRIPPVDVPVNPAAFGDNSEMSRGDVSRKVSMRASVIKDADLKEIEKHRGMVRTILNRLSFSLADGLRWVPDTSRELLAAELEHADAAGRAALLKAVGGESSLDIDAFVDSRKAELSKSLTDMAAALGAPTAEVDRVLEETLTKAKERLKRAKGGSLLPTLSWTRIAFSTDEDEHASPWGQAATFLFAVARFPRKALTDGFFMRGLSCNVLDLVEAMNIAGDDLCRDLRARNISSRCRQELLIIDRIAEEVSEPKDRCRLLRLLLDGKADEVDGELRKLAKANEHVVSSDNAISE